MRTLAVVSRTFVFIAWVYAIYKVVLFGDVLGEHVRHEHWYSLPNNSLQFYIDTVCIVLFGPLIVWSFYDCVTNLRNQQSLRGGEMPATEKIRFGNPFYIAIALSIIPLKLIKSNDIRIIYASLDVLLISLSVLLQPSLFGKRFAAFVNGKRSSGR